MRLLTRIRLFFLYSPSPGIDVFTIGLILGALGLPVTLSSGSWSQVSGPTAFLSGWFISLIGSCLLTHAVCRFRRNRDDWLADELRHTHHSTLWLSDAKLWAISNPEGHPVVKSSHWQDAALRALKIYKLNQEKQRERELKAWQERGCR